MNDLIFFSNVLNFLVRPKTDPDNVKITNLQIFFDFIQTKQLLAINSQK